MKIFNPIKKNNYKFFATILLGFLLFGFKDIAEIVYFPTKRLFIFIGLLLIFGSTFYYKIKLYNPLYGNIRILFIFFIFYVFLILTRPLLSGQFYSNDSMNPNSIYGFYSYFIPLIVFVDLRAFSIKKIFYIIICFTICGLFYFVLTFNEMLYIVNIGDLRTKQDNNFGLGELANIYYYWFGISYFSLLCFVINPFKK